jgi:hypothetical protein
MALIIVPVLAKKNGITSETFSPAKNFLINTTKIMDFGKDTINPLYCIFYYSDTEGKNYRASNFYTSLSRAQFKAKAREAQNERFIQINFIVFDSTQNVNILKEVNIDRIVYGYDTTHNGVSGYSVLVLERGSNQPHIKCITTHTIAEINHSSSGSVSLSGS